MKKLTIGLFIDTYFPMIDGVVMVVDNYAKRLTKHADVIVFAPSLKGFNDKELPYKVVRCKSIKIPFLDYNLPTPKLDKKFLKEVESYNLDLVHIHSPFTIGKIGINYAKKHNIPLIATMHSQFKQDFYRATNSKILSKKMTDIIMKSFEACDECWTMNEAISKVYTDDYGYTKTPRIVSNATEMEKVDKKEASNYINKKYNIAEDTKVFLFVGRINKLKNVFFIVDSLKLLKELKPNFNFKMIFVGSGQDEEELKKYINDQNMNDEIIMAGRVENRDELAKYYRRSDLFLFPSLYDVNSLVQIEAAAEETPTLFLKDAVTSSGIADNVNGFFSDYSKESYAARILEIMNDEKLYNKVSKNAYKDVYVSWDDAVLNAFKIYEKMVKEKEELNRHD